MSTERKIQDYLHFYLGCEVQIAARRMSTDGMVDDTRIGVFQGYWDNQRLSARIWFRTGPEGHVNIMFLKPILRPLSDMTEEEAKELLRLAEDGRGIIEVGSIVIKKGWNDVHYLLSKGFDLFGLIEFGLAIDKTTLKP